MEIEEVQDPPMMLELRQALRLPIRDPRLSAAAVLTFTVGMGACCAMFAVLDTVLLRPLPFPDSDRLVVAGRDTHRGSSNDLLISYPDWLSWRRADWLQISAVYHKSSGVLFAHDRPTTVWGVRASGEFLSVLRLNPTLGRGFTAEETEHGGPAVCLISHRLWSELYGRSPEVLGRRLPLYQRECEIVGVLPESLVDPIDLRPLDVLYPLAIGPDDMTRFASRWLYFVGRVRSGVALSAAAGEIEALSWAAYSVFSSPEDKIGFTLLPLNDHLFAEFRGVLWLLFGGVTLVLLIACLNVSNLLLARHSGRERELAIRAAMGATAGRLLGQLLAESLVLACTGGVLGLVAASWALDLLKALIPVRIPRFAELELSANVIGFTFGLILLSALAAGMLPALKGFRPRLVDCLRASRSIPTSAAGWRRLLVVFEIALTVILLTGAGLTGSSLLALLRVDTGFRTDNILIAHIRFLDRPSPQTATEFYRQAVSRLQAHPGLDSVSLIDRLPMGGGYARMNYSVREFAEEFRDGIAEEMIRLEARAAGPGLPEALGIPLLRGRWFEARDDLTAPPVAVISRSLARMLWGERDPIGRRLSLGTKEQRWAPVIGVVGDIRLFGPGGEVMPTVYRPIAQRPSGFGALVLHSRSGRFPSAEEIRERIDADRRRVMLTGVSSMREVYWSTLAMPRFLATLFGTFAVIALVLASVGVYGLVSYLISRQTREIGIRLVLGEAPGGIAWSLVRGTLILSLFGIVAGVIASLALSRFLQSISSQLGPQNPWVLVVTVLLMLPAALSACWGPSRRARRIDPAEALRTE